MKDTIEFLLNYGNPVIKYRTMTELISNNGRSQVQALEKDLLKYSETKERLNYLKSVESCNLYSIHGSKNYKLENSLPMLLDFGVKKGMEEFDEIMEPIIDQIDQKQEFPERHIFSKFAKIIIVPFLYKAGYREQWIVDFMNNRLDILYNFTVKKDYEIYDDNSNYKGVPSAFKDRDIIKPDLYINGKFKIPLIYDIYGLAEMSKKADTSTLDKILTVIDYILDKAYSNFYDGYGILYNGEREYYAMGWDAKLPIETGDTPSAEEIQRLELMAHFKNAVNHEWFQKCYKKLEKYRTEKGTYILPKTSIPKKKGYWVLARHMGLGENRRKKYGYELESTFRVMKINRILENLSKKDA